MIGLETAYPILNTALLGTVGQQRMVEILALKPREILKIPFPKIAVGEHANLTVFQPNTPWTFKLSESRSKARNTSLDGYEFTGKVVGVINNGKYLLNS